MVFRWLAMLSAGAAVLIAGAVVGAAPAAAHVTVSGQGATPGAEVAVLTFVVPDEKAAASTTALTVHLPDSPPLRTVLVQPQPGWTARRALSPSGVVTDVTWTADGAASGIHPGQFGQFVLRVGPLPHARALAFAAIQTYSDGTVVRWNETAAPGSGEPAHPKPVVTLTTAGPPARSPSAHGSGSSTALAVAALAVAAAALGVAVVTRAGPAARRRNPQPPSPRWP